LYIVNKSLFYLFQLGNEKKAKSFDFMAMFEEARKTAVERNQDKVGMLEILWLCFSKTTL